ncbi:response regulator [Lysobacter sp. FW306-1B-D06B]|uniref:response regulator n=1 Tax=Lysobacter sp. FW306-1B-D06B TaxID=3140250 RepID=UPI00314018E8
MKRLLIVDDETPVLHALRRLLQNHFKPQQLGVEICADSLHALQRLHEVHFDVLICDYGMPRMDGVTLLVRARELAPRTVRMMLTAATDFGTVLAAVNRAGVFRYIPKPWSEQQLLADLGAALVFDPAAAPSIEELERRRLEGLEPGITQVEWGPNGEVLMPGPLPTRLSEF